MPFAITELTDTHARKTNSMSKNEAAISSLEDSNKQSPISPPNFSEKSTF